MTEEIKLHCDKRVNRAWFEAFGPESGAPDPYYFELAERETLIERLTELREYNAGVTVDQGSGLRYEAGIIKAAIADLDAGREVFASFDEDGFWFLRPQ
jgi:hypothetical protein